MTTEPTYSIADLSRLTGVSIRTIRFYLSQGLLPAPGESGPGAHYAESHLDRLRLTKRLQEQHLPLAEIRSRLSQLTDTEISALAVAGERPAPATSALDYIRGVLAEDRRASPPSESLLRRKAPPPGFKASGAIARTEVAPPRLEQTASQSHPPERSQWDRLSLGPNVEIHVRRPLSRLEQKRVERLITIARQVLKEDTP